MKKTFLFLMLAIPATAFAQKFYVIGKDNKSVEKVEQTIKYEGYDIAKDSTAADFLVELLVDGKYKVVSFKRPYKGYIRIKRKDGDEVGRTEEVKGTPTAFNGYNAAYTIYAKIAKKYLPPLLKKCK